MLSLKFRILYLSMSVCAGMLLSCGDHSGHADKECMVRNQQLDSLVQSRLNVSPAVALASIDSLDSIGQMPPSLVCYYRGNVYNHMEQRATAELYFKKALEGDALQKESMLLFYKASDYLSSILANRGDHAEALNVATRCYEISRQDITSEGQRWTAVILHAMGYFQTQLGMNEEAEKNFSMAYMALSQMVAADSCYDNLLTCARVSCNILDAYTTTSQYGKALEWVPSAEKAVERLVKNPQCSEHNKVRYLGGIAIHKALVMLKQGADSSAEECYRKARDLGHFNNAYGIMDQSYFLRQAGRWDELADLMPKVDSLAKVWNVPLCLLYVREYMVPQFNAYMKSGRKEQAQEVAERMAASIDSVMSYEVNQKMKEIAVITERKDANLALVKQELMETYRWVKILGIMLSLLILAILAYSVYCFVQKKKEKSNTI